MAGSGEETFYDLLGLDRSADREAIEQAYRERVKQAHPDVSDDPAAPREFGRLTTAREVLLDGTERARYDRLGHAAYVREHVDGWSPEPASSQDPEPAAGNTGGTAATGTAAGRHTTGGSAASGHDGAGHTGDRSAWLGTDGPEPTAADGGAQGWQTAPGPYRRAETDTGGTERPLWRRVAGVARQVGPWLVVHAVFIGAALATVRFGYSGAAYLGLSWPALVAGGLLLAVAVVTSALHLLTRLYA
jgi:hypothetical protein